MAFLQSKLHNMLQVSKFVIIMDINLLYQKHNIIIITY